MAVQEHLNLLWSSVVKRHVFDPLRQRFLMELEVIENGSSAFHILEFSGVLSFLFFGEKSTGLFSDGDEYLELTSVHFNAIPIGSVTVENRSREWSLHEFRSCPNFALELWDAWLLLQAQSVSVDGVNYPILPTDHRS